MYCVLHVESFPNSKACSHSEPGTLLISNKLQHFSLQENPVILKSFYWLNKIFLQILKLTIKKAA